MLTMVRKYQSSCLVEKLTIAEKIVPAVSLKMSVRATKTTDVNAEMTKTGL